VSKRGRIRSYGSIVVVILVAGLCRLFIGGFAVEVAALSVISLGLGAILLLVFYEVGLSEDKQREEEEAAKRRSGGGRRSPANHMRPRRPS
jgi:hypothetical protein